MRSIVLQRCTLYTLINIKWLNKNKILPIINHNELFISMYRYPFKKINISRKCLTKFLNEVSSSALRRYLGFAEVYDGNANKKE